MSVVKELRLKIRSVSHTAVELLALVMLPLLCLRSTVLRQRKAPRYNVMVRALCTRQIGPGLCLDNVFLAFPYMSCCWFPPLLQVIFLKKKHHFL